MMASDETSPGGVNGDPCVTDLEMGKGVRTMKANDQLEPTVLVILGTPVVEPGLVSGIHFRSMNDSLTTGGWS
jgi:hypothetical protein